MRIARLDLARTRKSSPSWPVWLSWNSGWERDARVPGQPGGSATESWGRLLTEYSPHPPANLLGDVDDQGLGLLDPRDRRGSKNAYIDLVQKLALDACGRFTGGDTVLDYACGNGRLTRWAAQRVKRVVAVDPSLRLLQAAQQEGKPANALYASVEPSGMPFQDASFDGVLCIGLLRFLDPAQVGGVLRGFRRVLRPQGRLICVEKVYSQKRPGHLAREECEVLLAEAGFDLAESYPIRKGHWLPLYLVQFGLFPQRWWPSLARYELRKRCRTRGSSRDYFHHLFLGVRPAEDRDESLPRGGSMARGR